MFFFSYVLSSIKVALIKKTRKQNIKLSDENGKQMTKEVVTYL